MSGQKTLPLLLTTDEKQVANTILGNPTWCEKTAITNAELDRILETHYQVRKEALEDLIQLNPTGLNLNFINNFSRYFYVDAKCLCDEIVRVGAKGYNFTVTRTFGGGKVGITSFIRNLTDKKDLVLKSIRGTKPPRSLALNPIAYQDSMATVNPANRVNIFETNKKNQVLLTSGNDDFTNQTIMHLILNTILGYQPNYVHQYDAFYCRNEGYNIMELANGGDLSDYLSRQSSITDELMYDIIKQILQPLSLLKRDDYGFVHGDLKARNIFVHRTEDRTIFKIADYDKSSITWRGVRFYNSGASILRLWNNPFPLQENDFYYLSNLETIASRQLYSIQPYIMNSPIGFYLTYDLYTFIYSLVREPTVWSWLYPQYKGAMIKSNFYTFFESLWYPDDFAKVMEQLEVKHQAYLRAINPREREKLLVKLRSLANINKTFSKYQYKFKYNLDFVYNTFGIVAPSRINYSQVKYPIIRLSNGNKVCINDCGDGWCLTNNYETYWKSYNWDYCS